MNHREFSQIGKNELNQREFFEIKENFSETLTIYLNIESNFWRNLFLNFQIEKKLIESKRNIFLTCGNFSKSIEIYLYK